MFQSMSGKADGVRARGAGWMSGVGGLVDHVILRAMQRHADRHLPAELASVDRRAWMHEIIAFYQRLGEGLFQKPPMPEILEERRERLPDGGEVVDLGWPSGYEPAFPALREHYLAYAPNRRACARLFRHGDRGRPAMILLHGYQAGQFFVEERAFPARWLYSLGMDVVLFTQPFHALRGGRDAPIWPSANPARTNEGFAQAVFDVRALLRWLQPSRTVVAGMSLGGYTTSLLATVLPLDFACAMIPVASFSDLLWHHNAGRPQRLRAEREGITLELWQKAMAVHTPVLRAPKVPAERMLVLSAEGDRIAPPEHAERLARHFGCEEVRFTGGHVLQVGRREAFSALARRLATAGIIESR
jgi:pimeloyl-ACP methyl ester carboxylesterase